MRGGLRAAIRAVAIASVALLGGASNNIAPLDGASTVVPPSSSVGTGDTSTAASSSMVAPARPANPVPAVAQAPAAHAVATASFKAGPPRKRVVPASAVSTTTPVPTPATTAPGRQAGPSRTVTEGGLTIHYYPTRTGATAKSRSVAPHYLTGSQPNMTYHGGPIVHVPKIYMVFWGWNGVDSSSNDINTYLTNFLNGVGGSTWIQAQTQYTGTNGAVTNPTGQLLGTWTDTAAVVNSTYTPSDVANEALVAQGHFSATHDGDIQYVVVAPPGKHDSGFGTNFCAWHSFVNTGSNPVPFTNLPYLLDASSSCGKNRVNSGAAGALDGFSIVEGHEYAETLTDPQVSAGAFTGWYEGASNENGDKCAWLAGGEASTRNLPFSTGTFAVQSLWSNNQNSCVQQVPFWSSQAALPNNPTAPPYIFGESCPTNTSGNVLYCYAVGNQQDGLGGSLQGVIYRAAINPGTGNIGAAGWTLAYSDPGTGLQGFDGISCVDSGSGTTPSTSCYVAMSHATAPTATCSSGTCTQLLVCSADSGGCGTALAWSVINVAFANGSDLYGISCTDANNCQAVGSNATAVWAFTGPSNAANWHATTIGVSAQALLAVGCMVNGTSNDCIAGALNGDAIHFTTARGSIGLSYNSGPPNVGASVNGVACSEPGRCFAATDSGIRETHSDGASWSTPNSTGLFYAVACGPAQNSYVADCSAVGPSGNAVTSSNVDGTAAWGRDLELGTMEHDAIACSSNRGVNFCQSATQGPVFVR